MVRAPIILDLGNVLLKLDFDRFVRRAAAGGRRDEAAVRARYILGEPKRALETGRTGAEDFLAELAVWLDWPPERRGVLTEVWADIFDELPGAATAVADLAARGPLWLLSDTNALHLEHCLARFPFLDRCERVIASHETGRLKAEPGAFAAVTGLWPGPARDLVFLDDLPVNVERARAAGLRAFVFRDWPEAMGILRRERPELWA